MANIGFGLEVNKYAKQTGFDQFSTDLSDVLAETAKDAWKYNPVSSALRLYELNQSRDVDEPLISFQELNKKYKNLKNKESVPSPRLNSNVVILQAFK